MVLYAAAIAASPFRLRKVWFWSVCIIRVLGFILIAVTTGAIFRPQASSWTDAALLLIFPVSLVLASAALALWELYSAMETHHAGYAERLNSYSL
jgi:hypothetical protein